MIPIKDENPTRTFPIITVLIILVDALIYFYQASLGPYEEEFILRLGAIPYEVTRLRDMPPPNLISPPFTIISSMFLHGGFAHLAGNMLYLWVFGNNVEDTLGHFRFLLFYLVTGVAAAITQITFYPNSPIPMIGASGAIAGVLGAYILLFPHARILTLFFFFLIPRIIYMPAVFFLGIWFLFQILGSAGGGGVAWFAHIGGFIAGLILIKPFLPFRRRYFRFGG